ncbi:unnamed protein product [Brassicogethes aeneus]|uniref:Regulator of G-protein signaling loco n=1 Tax=Brassicogethes aeneus TaxID=1431903 RepID=A0A9P0FE16_BRAAE|nr:unnamed protein product [Brassicogethes aeneus]
MNPSRRRKKRPNYGIRTVEVMRGPNGFGFTISGQQPCILSCIVNNSPADQAGLRAGDFLISVNGASVSKIAHDAVVNLIGQCIGPIKMTIAENYYSDSSDEELDCGRMINSRKPKYMYKPRSHRTYKSDTRRAVEPINLNKLCIPGPNIYNEEPQHENLNNSNPVPMEDEAGPIEYKALVGYLGTIEMPKQLLPNSRLQTVCSCIRKLRQEKRTPTAVLMTILPTCLTLKNSSNNILAIYPTNRVVYVGSTTDRESRYFGLVTSAVCDTRNNDSLQKRYGEVNLWQNDEKKITVEASNSCHVFVTDPKIVDHTVHVKKAENFNINCTTDLITGNCLEFPRNALYIVSLVQNMYKLQNNDHVRNKHDDPNLGPLVANSPQPSASSNSDSGIGFRDDCGNISDRILVVEFPLHRVLPVLNNNNNNNRPVGIDASNLSLEGLDVPLNNDQGQNYERCHNNLVLEHPNNLSKAGGSNDKNNDMKQLNNLNNIRACEGNIKNIIEKSDSFTKNDYFLKQNNDEEVQYNTDFSRLNCRALPDGSKKSRCQSPLSIVSSDDNTRTADMTYNERSVDVEGTPVKKSCESVSLHSECDFKSSMDNISVHSSKSFEFGNLVHVFKTPSTKFFERKAKRQLKISSVDGLDKYNENVMNYKLSPKVYGVAKPNFSCEELNNLDTVERFGYGSLQEICWSENRRNIAQSEPDVRSPRSGNNSVSLFTAENIKLLTLHGVAFGGGLASITQRTISGQNFCQ